MAKKNHYRPEDGYVTAGLPSVGYGLVSTRDDDARIRVVERLKYSDPVALEAQLADFNDSLEKPRCEIDGYWGSRRLTISGWRDTTDEERAQIQDMKTRRDEKKQAEAEREKELRRKHREREKRAQANWEAQMDKAEEQADDRIVAQALEVLKKRGTTIQIIEERGIHL